MQSSRAKAAAYEKLDWRNEGSHSHGVSCQVLPLEYKLTVFDLKGLAHTATSPQLLATEQANFAGLLPAILLTTLNRDFYATNVLAVALSYLHVGGKTPTLL